MEHTHSSLLCPVQRLRCFWQWEDPAQHCLAAAELLLSSHQQSQLSVRESCNRKTMKNYMIKVWLVFHCIPFFICRTETLGEYQRVDSVSELLKTLQNSFLFCKTLTEVDAVGSVVFLMDGWQELELSSSKNSASTKVFFFFSNDFLLVNLWDS